MANLEKVFERMCKTMGILSNPTEQKLDFRGICSDLNITQSTSDDDAVDKIIEYFKNGFYVVNARSGYLEKIDSINCKPVGYAYAKSFGSVLAGPFNYVESARTWIRYQVLRRDRGNVNNTCM